MVCMRHYTSIIMISNIKCKFIICDSDIPDIYCVEWFKMWGYRLSVDGDKFCIMTMDHYNGLCSLLILQNTKQNIVISEIFRYFHQVAQNRL